MTCSHPSNSFDIFSLVHVSFALFIAFDLGVVVKAHGHDASTTRNKDFILYLVYLFFMSLPSRKFSLRKAVTRATRLTYYVHQCSNSPQGRTTSYICVCISLYTPLGSHLCFQPVHDVNGHRSIWTQSILPRASEQVLVSEAIRINVTVTNYMDLQASDFAVKMTIARTWLLSSST